MTLFHELILVSLGRRESLSVQPTDAQWEEIIATAKKQALLGMLMPAVENAVEAGSNGLYPKPVKQIMAVSMMLESRNAVMNDRAASLTQTFAEAGFRTCILKGQGNAMLYPRPSLRQCGDIDIWVDGSRKAVLEFLRPRYPVKLPTYHHVEVRFFGDAPVEVHYRPTWFYSPLRNSRFEKWIASCRDAQFSGPATAGGFNVPTPEFNLVFNLIHIFRHMFDEGVGLRQLLDYYYILSASTPEQRAAALNVLETLGLRKFAGAIMYVESEFFEADALLCEPDAERGPRVLEEINRTGNFGLYDSRNAHSRGESQFHRFLRRMKGPVRLFLLAPDEALWAPLWKAWHIMARKMY